MTFTFYVCLSLKPKAGHSPGLAVNSKDFVGFFFLFIGFMLPDFWVVAIGFTFFQPFSCVIELARKEIRIRPGCSAINLQNYKVGLDFVHFLQGNDGHRVRPNWGVGGTHWFYGLLPA